MKINHESVINHILNAIKFCNEDSVLVPAKAKLYEALQIVENVGKKRNIREDQAAFFAEQAKKKQEQWLEMIKKGMVDGQNGINQSSPRRFEE